MDAAALLRDLLKPLPPEALVPAGWVLQHLNAPEIPEPDSPVDLSCEQVAAQLGRKACTIRGWAASGLLPRCYRLRGREWRIPQASVREFLARAQEQQGQEPAPASVPDLGAWREVRR